MFFTFLDRSLSYDCPSCGSQCCKGRGLLLDASREAVRFARLEPRLAALLHPLDARFVQAVEVSDGCSMLLPSGLCHIEEKLGRAEKPHTCRLFPFNRIFRAGETQIVDFNARICPLKDARGAGVSWDELRRELLEQSGFTEGEMPLPEGAREVGWEAHETLVRDGSARFLDEPDLCAFAAFQEEAVLAAMRGTAPAQDLSRRTELLRALLGKWRALHGVLGDPGLAEAARKAARQVALLTSSWRISALFGAGAGPYPAEVQHLPKRLLATAHLLELSHLGRQREPGLRAATETFLGAAPLASMLGLFPRKAKLRKPGTPHAALSAPLQALFDKLDGTRTLGEAAAFGLQPFEPALRAMAFSAFACGDAEVEIG